MSAIIPRKPAAVNVYETVYVVFLQLFRAMQIFFLHIFFHQPA